MLAIVAATVSTATCRLSEFGTPPPSEFGGLLKVSGPVVDSATVGSTAIRVDSITIRNAGGGELTWHAHAVHTTSWLTLQPDSGMAGDLLRVRADPTGLALGVYRDSVVIEASSGGAVLVPVEFRILGK